MKKIIKRILKLTMLTLFVATLTVAYIILFPQELFANKLSYREFTVFSNHKIDENIKIVLDNSLALVQKSELYDSKYKFNIILCYRSLYNKIDDKIFGNGPAARSALNNIKIKVRINAKRNDAFITFHKACDANLTELIAHEITHCLQYDKYGILKFNSFRHPALWKLEGYPEYISKQKELSGKSYSLKNNIDRYIKLKTEARDVWILPEDGGCEVPEYYYRGRLMIEYLIDIRYFTYDEILKDTVSENAVYQQMIEWKNSTQANRD